jgi:hypothetical protein
VNLKASWIASAFFTPRERTRVGTVTDSKVSDEVLKTAKGADQEKKAEELKGGLPESHK